MAEDDGGGGKRAHGDLEFDGEIILEILARLPVKSLMRFQCVSKPWNALISDPYFTKKHFKNAEMGITENSSRLLHSLEPPQSIDHEASKDLKHYGNGHFANRVLDFPVFGYSYKRIVGCCNGLICISLGGIDFMYQILQVFPSPFNTASFSRCGYDPATDDYKLGRSQHMARKGICPI